MYVGRTRLSLADIRHYNSAQGRMQYMLHDHDCRHYVNRLVKYTTGVEHSTQHMKRHYFLSRHAERWLWYGWFISVTQLATDVGNWSHIQAGAAATLLAVTGRNTVWDGTCCGWGQQLLKSPTMRSWQPAGSQRSKSATALALMAPAAGVGAHQPKRARGAASGAAVDEPGVYPGHQTLLDGSSSSSRMLRSYDEVWGAGGSSSSVICSSVGGGSAGVGRQVLTLPSPRLSWGRRAGHTVVQR
eukprot:gene2253-2565_t